ncbi:unnamed protein product [Parascedosporium putredinis]|uniref:Zn(2)-C6 fungal-type domain-containing protein n=1 Tax=Parascedosporium putredinis TaxID=1442378 RepID=A0A9P1H5F2_9PEZI|nr:unnamed protein product [Parascedosporium putredinis]CAI7996315.1 unnamed protein product [Parascedosporium putredinis]
MASSQPPKRVRTGCLKCRVRRRKCDEGKPRCQRCIAGGFECQYGTRLSFLQKNAITSVPSQPSPTEGPTPTYRKVQFVREEKASSSTKTNPQLSVRDASTTSCDTPSGSEDRSVAGPDTPSSPPPLQFVIEARPFTTSPSSAQPQPQSSRLGPEKPDGIKSPASPEGPQQRPPQGQRSTNGYEIALDALLSLGTEQGSPDEESLALMPFSPGQPFSPTRDLLSPSGEKRTSFSPFSSLVIQPSAKILRTNSQDVSFNRPELRRQHSTPQTDASPSIIITEQSASELDNLAAIPIIPETQVLEILRHYRYEISPWLDICDLGQAFGVTAPCFASSSNAILYSLLAFTSNVSQRTPITMPLDGIADLLGQSVMPFESHPMTTPLYYLMLRFDLSQALANEQPLNLPLWMPLDFGRRSELAVSVFHATAQALFLCGRVINLIYGGVECTGSTDSLIVQWTGLIEELSSWYAHRPEEVKPMVDLDGKGDAFPTILFTTGAALLSNQLYHTGMLLLLRNRPRTFKGVGTGHKPSSSMSSLWHARRICGISSPTRLAARGIRVS